MYRSNLVVLNVMFNYQLKFPVTHLRKSQLTTQVLEVSVSHGAESGRTAYGVGESLVIVLFTRTRKVHRGIYW